MTIHIDAWSDFTCPFSFLMSLRLRKLAATHDILIRWRSFQLRPPGVPMLQPHEKAAVLEQRERAGRQIHAEYGLILDPGTVESDTRLAQIALQYANRQNRGTAFHDILMDAYWAGAADIEDTDILETAGRKAGIDLDEMGLSWEDSLFASLVDSDRALASQYGITALPATLAAKKFLISGTQPLSVLEDVIIKAEQEQYANAPVSLAS